MENACKKPLSRYWLIIGVIALAIAGLYAAPLAWMRSPAVKNSPELTRLFQDALVVHVDLSVLVWFLAVACLMWSLLTRGARQVIPYLEEAALWCFALSIAAITLSPYAPNATAHMSNYIPVIHSPVFFMGIVLVFCGVALMLVKLLLSYRRRPVSMPDMAPDLRRGLSFGLLTAAIITAISLAAFTYSALTLPPEPDLTYRYELMFWAGGHVLQFTHTQMLLVAWLMLAAALGYPVIGHKKLYALFSIGLIVALTTPIGYMVGDATTFEHKQFFTDQMIYGGGIAPGLLGLVMIVVIWKTRAQKHGEKRALWSALLMSLVLFLYGGFLGLMISGQNVTIPAHYHGSIVGVTLALMGLAYLLMPTLGYRDVTSWRSAFWQPIVFGMGQMMHVSGLAYSGGYGVLRKMPGGIKDAPLDVQVALGSIGMGGLLAIIGGLMFVVVAIRAMRRLTIPPAQ